MSKVKTKKDKDITIYCDVTKCVACRTCELACAVEHSKSKDLADSIIEKDTPRKRLTVSAINGKSISIHCQHCKEAPCVTACMSGALSKDEKTGATVQDNEKCVGCWMCVMTCPFGAIVGDKTKHIAVKCDLCPDRDDYACVITCPTGALFAGTKEEFEKKIKDKKVGKNK